MLHLSEDDRGPAIVLLMRGIAKIQPIQGPSVDDIFWKAPSHWEGSRRSTDLAAVQVWYSIEERQYSDQFHANRILIGVLYGDVESALFFMTPT